MFERRGVTDLFSLVTDEPEFLQGASVADKVIGRGAAMLLVKGGARSVYAEVISSGAREVLKRAGIEVSFGTQVPNIINRAGTDICPDTTLLDKEVQTLAEEDLQKLATQTHLGLRQSAAEVQAGRQKVKQERANRLPQVALVAAEHVDGPITIEVPVLDNNFHYWYVGVGVSYNFSALFKNNRKLKQARLNVRRAEELHELAQEQVENAVQAGYVDFLTSFTDWHTQEKSVALANENYSVVSNRYANEMALLTDMLDASNMKLSADLGLVNARIDVIYHYYKMKYLTHTL